MSSSSLALHREIKVTGDHGAFQGPQAQLDLLELRYATWVRMRVQINSNYSILIVKQKCDVRKKCTQCLQIICKTCEQTSSQKSAALMQECYQPSVQHVRKLWECTYYIHIRCPMTIYLFSLSVHTDFSLSLLQSIEILGLLIFWNMWTRW